MLVLGCWFPKVSPALETMHKRFADVLGATRRRVHARIGACRIPRAGVPKRRSVEALREFGCVGQVTDDELRAAAEQLQVVRYERGQESPSQILGALTGRTKSHRNLCSGMCHTTIILAAFLQPKLHPFSKSILMRQSNTARYVPPFVVCCVALLMGTFSQCELSFCSTTGNAADLFGTFRRGAASTQSC